MQHLQCTSLCTTYVDVFCRIWDAWTKCLQTLFVFISSKRDNRNVLVRISILRNAFIGRCSVSQYHQDVLHRMEGVVGEACGDDMIALEVYQKLCKNELSV